MILSRHAEVRCQQRAIPRQVLEWLVEHGNRVHDHRGAKVVHFDKRSVRTLENRYGREMVRQYAGKLNSYCVLSEDDVVITAGRRD